MLGTKISDGYVQVWTPMARVSDNAVGIYEGVGSTGKLLLRLDSDATLVELTPAQARILTGAEVTTRNAAINLAACQAANDTAAAALTTAGGVPCP